MVHMFINSNMKPRNMKQAKHKKIMGTTVNFKRNSNYAYARNDIPTQNSAYGQNKLVKLTSAMRGHNHNIDQKLPSVVLVVLPFRSDTESVTATVNPSQSHNLSHSQSQVTISETTTSTLETEIN